MAPPDRGGHWRRSLLVLVLGLLPPFLWFLGEELLEPQGAQVAAVQLARDPAPAQSAPLPEGALHTTTATASAAQQAQVKAGRVLGFLHGVGFPGCLLAAGFTTIFLHARLLPDAAGMGPFLARFLGIGLLVCVPSAFLWCYGWMPLVDLLWEAGGGRMVAYGPAYPARPSRGGVTLAAHNWGETATLLYTPFLLAIVAVISGMRDGARSRPAG